MELKCAIYERKSVRSFENTPVSDEIISKIKDFASGIKPLYPDIKTAFEIVDKKYVKTVCPWVTPQVISIYSQKKDGCYENVGFVFQQLELYINSLGLGACWLGLGKTDGKINSNFEKEGLEFVITMAFGYPKGEAKRKTIQEFKRLCLSEISDVSDERLNAARVAPSSVNSQPWYFVHDGDVIHTFCKRKALVNTVPLYMNLIDIGIALSHIYVENTETFQFFKANEYEKIKNCRYVGSFKI